MQYFKKRLLKCFRAGSVPALESENIEWVPSAAGEFPFSDKTRRRSLFAQSFSEAELFTNNNEDLHVPFSFYISAIQRDCK